MSCSLLLLNNNVVELQELTNSVTGVADTAATVTMTLKDLNGADVTGETWPVTLVHVATGTYRYTLDSAIGISDRKSYIATVDVTGTGSETGHWEVTIPAKKRRS